MAGCHLAEFRLHSEWTEQNRSRPGLLHSVEQGLCTVLVIAVDDHDARINTFPTSNPAE